MLEVSRHIGDIGFSDEREIEAVCYVCTSEGKLVSSSGHAGCTR